MAKKFGALLREIREHAEVTMGQLARHLDVSVPYLSDVERGNRPPLVDSKIFRAAEFLDVQPDELLRAAAEARGAFQLDASRVSEPARQLGAMLARQWGEMSDKKVENVLRALQEEED
ncbi:MAG TPA: helix-turn-helix transcriptional regulator [Thermoanaerobaculia bacterium]|jgi:transcriptional regulator with XRE-family HTH domain